MYWNGTNLPAEWIICMTLPGSSNSLLKISLCSVLSQSFVNVHVLAGMLIFYDGRGLYFWNPGVSFTSSSKHVEYAVIPWRHNNKSAPKTTGLQNFVVTKLRVSGGVWSKCWEWGARHSPLQRCATHVTERYLTQSADQQVNWRMPNK